jgi:multidrug efflux pump subunit AcrA (membrane-fusion protein)
MNITKGNLILILSIPFIILLAWGIFITFRLSSTEATLKQSLATLSQTQNELADTKQQLTGVRTELTTTQDTLAQTKTTLSQTQTQLDTTKTELTGTITQLLTTQSQLASTQSQLSSATTELVSTKSQLSDAQSQLASSQQQLADDQKTLLALGITVHTATTAWDFNGQQWTHTDNTQATDPTWNQLTAFVAQDNTDQHPYDINSFNCVNYATTVYNHAENSNIEAAVVTLTLRNEPVGHAIDAFITSDYGMVYVDCTQQDTIARIEVGKTYRAVSPGDIPPSQDRNDAWWDALSYNYYYLPNVYGGQAVVDSIDFYW